MLVVAVREPATDGRANDAVRSAVADAFDVRAGAVRIVSGHRSRTKLLEVTDAPAGAPGELRRLLDA